MSQIYLIRLCSRYREDDDQVVSFDGTPEEAAVEAQRWANETCDIVVVAQHKRRFIPEGLPAREGGL